MGFQGFFILIWVILFALNVQAKVACAEVFAKNTFELIGEHRSLIVSGLKRELLVFQPTRPSSNLAPVMIYFHGTNHPVELSQSPNSPYGLAYENTYIQTLMDAGFVVIAPTSNRITPYYLPPSVLAWEANILPYSSHFKNGRDYLLTKAILDGLEDISDVAVDRKNIFLSGFSSGGYMSSRLAQDPEMAKQIRGIVVHSASYGECVASQCSVPASLPAWHPPTLLVANKDDSIVPFSTVELYLSRLSQNGIPVKTQFSENGDHAWKKNHSTAIAEWLQKRFN